MPSEQDQKSRATNRSMDSTTPRDRLFCAALSVGLQQGFGHVTLDAVAKQAGVSKGALLHHFPSKASLIEGLLKRCLETRESGRDEDTLPPHPVGSSHYDALAVATLIAGSENPALLQPLANRLLHRNGASETCNALDHPFQMMKALAAALKLD